MHGRFSATLTYLFPPHKSVNLSAPPARPVATRPLGNPHPSKPLSQAPNMLLSAIAAPRARVCDTPDVNLARYLGNRLDNVPFELLSTAGWTLSMKRTPGWASKNPNADGRGCDDRQSNGVPVIALMILQHVWRTEWVQPQGSISRGGERAVI